MLLAHHNSACCHTTPETALNQLSLPNAGALNALPTVTTVRNHLSPFPITVSQERAAVRAAQTEALETQDVLQRLHLANRVMAEARGLLSAKCALLTLSSASPGS